MDLHQAMRELQSSRRENINRFVLPKLACNFTHVRVGFVDIRHR